jgi:hypothetical protein
VLSSHPLANRAPAPAVCGFRRCQAHWAVSMVSGHAFRDLSRADDDNGHNHNPSLNDDDDRHHHDLGKRLGRRRTSVDRPESGASTLWLKGACFSSSDSTRAKEPVSSSSFHRTTTLVLACGLLAHGCTFVDGRDERWRTLTSRRRRDECRLGRTTAWRMAGRDEFDSSRRASCSSRVGLPRRIWVHPRGGWDELSETSVVLVSTVLVSTTDVGDGTSRRAPCSSRQAIRDSRRWETTRRDERSRLVFARRTGSHPRAGSVHPAGLVGNRGARGSGQARTRRGCGVDGCGCGVGPPDPSQTRAMPYLDATR